MYFNLLVLLCLVGEMFAGLCDVGFCAWEGGEGSVIISHSLRFFGIFGFFFVFGYFYLLSHNSCMTLMAVAVCQAL